MNTHNKNNKTTLINLMYRISRISLYVVLLTFCLIIRKNLVREVILM